jgi:hypothetical protein
VWIGKSSIRVKEKTTGKNGRNIEKTRQPCSAASLTVEVGPGKGLDNGQAEQEVSYRHPALHDNISENVKEKQDPLAFSFLFFPSFSLLTYLCHDEKEKQNKI